MKYAVKGSTYLLGLIYVVFGLNFWFHFIPAPPMPAAAGALIGALAGSHIFTLVKITEVVGGALLLAGIARPLALVVLAPVTLNIFLFHVFLAPQGMFVQVLMLVMHVFLGYAYRTTFAPLFKKG
jgi:putative oxidoreductase